VASPQEFLHAQVEARFRGGFAINPFHFAFQRPGQNGKKKHLTHIFKINPVFFIK
jgi:hypothetical protein